MADPVVSRRLARERTSHREINRTAHARGWDTGDPTRNPENAQSPPSGTIGAAGGSGTGTDPITGETLTGFLMDISTLNGPDVLF